MLFVCLFIDILFFDIFGTWDCHQGIIINPELKEDIKYYLKKSNMKNRLKY